MTPWTIDASDKAIDAKLKKFRSNKRVMNGYQRALRALAESDDPASAGSRKRGRLGGLYSYSLTRSHRLIYGTDYGERVIRVINLGDHKEVYGQDRRA